MSQNKQWWERAQKTLPGGVNSPVRAFKAVPGDPVFFARAQGSRFWDEDGREYVDFCQSWGPLILGHADPDVLGAVREAIDEGLTFGAPSRREVELGEAFLKRVGVYDQVRFVSSGTEATMSAIRLARGATGRDLVVKFEGCYHGHADHLLVEAGSGLATFGTPSSAGVPADFSRHTAVLPLDDEDALRSFFAARGHECAAVIVEPVPANAGLLIQKDSFLPTLRELCTQHGTLLIFDEVITGFRVGPSGASGRFGIQPDIGCFGKIMGGGLPVGAYAASTEIMKSISPLGGVYQAGTLSGNPVAMAGGLATLAKTGRPGFYEALETRTAHFAERLQSVLRNAGHEATVVHIGSLFWIAFQQPAPRTYPGIHAGGAAVYGALHRALLDEGVYLAPSAYEVGFLSAAHTDADLDFAVAAFTRALARIAS